MKNCTEPDREKCPHLCSDFCLAESQANRPPAATTCSAPLELWIQWHGDNDESEDDSLPVSELEVTWCRDKLYERDIEYVHADEIRRALFGHRKSQLWGDNGLIAATMRCVNAIGRIEDLVTTDHESKEAFIERVKGILGLRQNAEASHGEKE